MSPLVKMKRQANFKDFKGFEAFKGLAEQKNLYSTRGPLKHSFHPRLKLAHSCQKKPNLYTNSLNNGILKKMFYKG
jgi:hypothetical protein